VLTESGYLWALIVYIASALFALVLFNLWFLKGRSLALRVLLSFPLAALLFTPAYIEPDAETFAPALIVAAFQWLSQGPEFAEHALRPLALFSGVGLGAGLLMAGVLTVRERRARAG
jgi:hypothetical protein